MKKLLCFILILPFLILPVSTYAAASQPQMVITKVVVNDNKAIINAEITNNNAKMLRLNLYYIMVNLTDKDGNKITVKISNKTIKHIRIKTKETTKVRWMVNITNSEKYKFNKGFTYTYKFKPYVDIA